MSEQLTELAIVKAQRNQLAANLHDLHVSHQMTLAALAETNVRLGAAEAKISFLQERLAFVTGAPEVNQIPLEVFKPNNVVPLADDADAAA